MELNGEDSLNNDGELMSNGLIPVALKHCPDYTYSSVLAAVQTCLQAIHFSPSAGAKVLVKPNLLKADSTGLCCTSPVVVEAVCECLLEYGCTVTVGDSPAFGSAASVARSIGLTEGLERLGVPLITLDSPACVTFASGNSIGISRSALESDLLVNVPRMKAHTQMRATFAVKNLFGCVSGVRKAIAHSTHGDKANAFRELLVDVALALPESVSVVDGITCMHKTGPSGGEPYSLGLIGAAGDPVSLDTALYSVLGCTVDEMPLWGELQRKNVRGAFQEQLEYVLATPQEFDAEGFILPFHLIPETFHPIRLIRSGLKRFWKRYLCP
ncbi:DUF362 domain-containing protein [Halodesulfovibrio spirochaetisodalis]|nr:DUF362 domain-containing protein [Halodesulfovibrio spirochaetisodalis]